MKYPAEPRDHEEQPDYYQEVQQVQPWFNKIKLSMCHLCKYNDDERCYNFKVEVNGTSTKSHVAKIHAKTWPHRTTKILTMPDIIRVYDCKYICRKEVPIGKVA